MIERISVFDLDGTVIDSSHRYRTRTDATGIVRIDLDYWRDNEYRAGNDSLLPLATQYKADLQDKNCYVIVATARIMRVPDRAFLRDMLGDPDYLISRAPDDARSGGLLKALGLQRFMNLKNFRDANAVFYEDNLEYLRVVCRRHPRIRGVYVPSMQGH